MSENIDALIGTYWRPREGLPTSTKRRRCRFVRSRNKARPHLLVVCGVMAPGVLATGQESIHPDYLMEHYEQVV